MSTRSNSTKRSNFVSNTPSAIAGVFSQKKKRVHANPPSTEAKSALPSDSNSKRMSKRVASTTILESPIAGESLAAIHTQSISPNLLIPNNATTETMTVDASASVGVEEPTQAEPIKKTRGKSRGLNADKLHEQLGKRIPITIEEAIGRPTGPFAQMFASEIGFTIRNHAPLDLEQWKDVTPEVTTSLVKRLTTKYDIDMSQPIVKRYVNKAFQTCFTNFRNKLKNHFAEFATKEEALQNRHKDVKSDKDWAFLCDYFSSEKFKSRSEKNAANRSKLKYHHKNGSKSYMSSSTQTGEMLGPIERFESHYKSKAKGWDLHAKEKYDEMVLLRIETTKEDGTRTMTDEEICKQVLGAKSGSIKGCGFGPRPPPAKPSQSSLHDMYEKNKALEDKIKDQKAQINALEEKTKKFEEFMANFNNQQSLDS